MTRSEMNQQTRKIAQWVERTHGAGWYFSVSKSGVINGRRRGEKKVLGTVSEAVKA